jgi:hypothetical protein
MGALLDFLRSMFNDEPPTVDQNSYRAGGSLGGL